MKRSNEIDARGAIPESWNCIDCGVNTAPGCSNRVEFEKALQASVLTASGQRSVTQKFDDRTEVYTVKPAVWKAAGMDSFSGCLCVGCLERRLGRILTPKDFLRGNTLNSLPGTDRLLSRRDGA